MQDDGGLVFVGTFFGSSLLCPRQESPHACGAPNHSSRNQPPWLRRTSVHSHQNANFQKLVGRQSNLSSDGHFVRQLSRRVDR